MAAEIEKALKDKCSVDPTLELLHSQWVYDKRLVGQALQAVGNTFPHYSRHDASHSNTILVQITRVLGNRVQQLTATDLWMLLEAAYWHDMGMVVDDATIRKWWDTPEFVRHLDDLSESADDVLAAAAILLRDAKLRCKASALDVRQAATLVIADYARGKHADRSGLLMDNPLSIGLQSPRVLIPARLFRWIRQIAISHGKSKDFVDQLPQSESGMGTDLCHPRFVACMLRLGDLLDLDNGRFCPILASTVSRLPASSLAHVGKHASIQRFCVSPEKIDVEAVCDSRVDQELDDPYAVYEATTTWLGWLEEELQYLASHWTDITPPNFGGAPSIGTIEARLTDYVRTKDGDRPKFKIDESTFFELIRSNRLYQEQHAWLRELIANADDATRIRAFIDNPQRAREIAEDKAGNPLEKLIKLMADYPIHVTIKNDGNHNLKIMIEDQGTGISGDDLDYILTIGSSKRNPFRRQYIRSMPEIMRPTGTFGLGLQSIFMVTDSARIETTQFRSREQLQIVLRRKRMTTDTKEGLPANLASLSSSGPTGVYAKKLSDAKTKIGTRLEFTILPELLDKDVKAEEPTISTERPRRAMKGESPEGAVSSGTDPILQELGGMEVAYLEDLVRKISNHTLVPIELNGKLLKKESRGDRVFFSHQTGCAVQFFPCTLEDNPIKLRFRGFEVPNHDLPKTGLINIEVDMHFGDAASLLTASRDSLTPRGQIVVADRIKQSLAEVFADYVKSLEPKSQNTEVKSGRNRESVASKKKAPYRQSEASKMLNYARMYAYLYLGWGTGKLENSFEGVHLGNRSTSFDQLRNEKQFNLRVSSYESVIKGKYTLIKPLPNWVTDALFRLEQPKEIALVESDTIEYHFGTPSQSSKAPTQDYAAILGGISREIPNSAEYVRPLFPTIAETDDLAVDYANLPYWTYPRRLILNRQIVSPFEFRFYAGRHQVRSSHLYYYLQWLSGRLGINEDSEDAYKKLIDSVRQLASQLISSKLTLYLEDGRKRFTMSYVNSLLKDLTPKS